MINFMFLPTFNTLYTHLITPITVILRALSGSHSFWDADTLLNGKNPLQLTYVINTLTT